MNTFETILVTCVTFYLTHNGGYTFYQKCMFLALTVNEGMCHGDFWGKYKLLRHWINYKAVFKTTLSSESFVNNIELKINVSNKCNNIFVF